jgi:hypothetical protein
MPPLQWLLYFWTHDYLLGPERLSRKRIQSFFTESKNPDKYFVREKKEH